MFWILLIFLFFSRGDSVSIGKIDNYIMINGTSNSLFNINEEQCICQMITSNGLISTLNYFPINQTCQLFNSNITSVFIQFNYNSSFIFINQSVISIQTMQINNSSISMTTSGDMITTTTTTTSSSTITVTTTSNTNTTISSISALTTAKVRTIEVITRAGDMIVGLYNTTAGGSTGSKNGRYSSSGSELPAQAMDNSTVTKYLNFGVTGGYNVVAPAPGVGTGFYVIPTVSNASVAIALLFATANDSPNRDPITVTLEGSNANALDDGSSWTLIYNGSTGISPLVDPGRMQYVLQQNFSNTIPYSSYRLLVTSQRGPEWAVQYAEAQIIGYI